MVALAKDRLWKSRQTVEHEGPAAAGAVIFEGALVARNAAGDIVKGTTALNLKACGIAIAPCNNAAGAAGALNVKFRRGCFAFAIDGADAVTKADIENTVFITDDQTICRTNGGGTKSAAGRLVDIDASGAWVRVGL